MTQYWVYQALQLRSLILPWCLFHQYQSKGIQSLCPSYFNYQCCYVKYDFLLRKSLQYHRWLRWAYFKLKLLSWTCLLLNPKSKMFLFLIVSQVKLINIVQSQPLSLTLLELIDSLILFVVFPHLNKLYSLVI